VTETDLNRRQGSLVDEASAATNETKLSPAAAVRSIHQPRPEAVNAPSEQSSLHLPAGTTGPLADPTPQTSNITHLKVEFWTYYVVCSSFFVCFTLNNFSFLSDGTYCQVGF